MELKYIREMACPVCGCTIIVKESIETSSGKIRTHCNGERWEHRQFVCGQELAHNPGARHTEICTYNVCTNNETYKAAQKNREEATKELHKYIDSLNISDSVKKSWKGWIY